MRYFYFFTLFISSYLTLSGYVFSQDFDTTKYDNGFFIIEKNERFGIGRHVDSINSFPYDEVFYNENSMPKYVLIAKNQLWGLVDLDNNELIPPIYERLNLLKDEDQYEDSMIYFIAKKNGKTGSLNLRNETITPFTIDKVNSWICGSYVTYIMQDQKFGIMDSKGTTLYPMIYDNIFLQNELNYAKVKIDDKVGIMKNKDSSFIPIIYDNILFEDDEDYTKQVWYAQSDSLWTKINFESKIIANNISDSLIRRKFQSLTYGNRDFQYIQSAFKGWNQPPDFDMNYTLENSRELTKKIEEIIEQKSDSMLSFTHFYEKPIDEFYTDDYRLFLFPILVNLGFQLTSSGGGYLSFTKTMENKDCTCIIEKRFKETIENNKKYNVTESIKCKKRIYESWENPDE